MDERGSVPTLEASASRYLECGQHLLFALLLVLGTARAVLVDHGTADRGVAALVGAALTAVWYVVGAVMSRAGQDRARRRREAELRGMRLPSDDLRDDAASTRSRVRRAGDAEHAGDAEEAITARGARGGLAWFVVLVACWLGLLWISPDFSWVAFALFLLAIHLLSTPAALGTIAALTCCVVASQVSAGVPSPGRIVGPVVGAIVAAGAGLIYRRILAESEDRRRLVAELVVAQDDLVAVHDELAATQREAGVLTERQRLARDIHDTLAQGLSSIVLLSRAGLAGDDAARTDVLRQIEATAADNLEEARRVVHALTPASLEAAPLPTALTRLLERLREQTSLETTIDVDGDMTTLGTSGEVALLRVAQSALSNVRLHARADRVVVALTNTGDAVMLDVVDDGRGFDPARLDAAPLGGTGFGLRAMRERLATLGGALGVDSAPGEGTTLTATVPLANPTAAAGRPPAGGDRSATVETAVDPDHTATDPTATDPTATDPTATDQATPDHPPTDHPGSPR
ncbi:sensor histidine kinase [Mobilicoccus pelagius]|nr:sensor histidine kinase [Mobilicoccus pelagius]